MAWGQGMRRLRQSLHGEQLNATLIAGISASLIAAGTEEEFSRVMRDEIAPSFGGVANVLAYADHGRWYVPAGHGFNPVLSRHKHGESLDARNPSNDALRSGGPLFVGSRREFDSRWPDWSDNFEWTTGRAFGVVPIGTVDSPLASMGLDYGSEYRPSTADRALSATLQQLAGQALRRIRSQQSRTDLVRSLRLSLVPPTVDRVPGLDIAVRYRPALDGLDFGGDWYDSFEMPDGTVALVMGDVQGHDVDAAALMGQARASIRALAFVDGDPGTVLARANDLFHTTIERRFISCALLRYSPFTRTVQAAYAGHIPAAWASPDGTCGTLKSEAGPVLGVVPGASYPVRSVQLSPESFVVLVTDGLVEGPTQSLQCGMTRLGALGAESLTNGSGTEEIAETLMTLVATTGHRDDAALLVARTTPSPARRVQVHRPAR